MTVGLGWSARHPQLGVAGVLEAVGRLRGDDHDVAGGNGDLLVAHGEARGPLRDDERLRIGVEVQVRALAVVVLGEEERDAGVLSALVLRGARAEREVLEGGDLGGHRPSVKIGAGHRDPRRLRAPGARLLRPRPDRRGDRLPLLRARPRGARPADHLVLGDGVARRALLRRRRVRPPRPPARPDRPARRALRALAPLWDTTVDELFQGATADGAKAHAARVAAAFNRRLRHGDAVAPETDPGAGGLPVIHQYKPRAS